VGTDGEPLDALVLMLDPAHPGVRVRARVVGVFWIMTGHGRETKLVCVPAADPAYASVATLSQLPPHQLQEIAHFFDIYRFGSREVRPLRRPRRGRHRHQACQPPDRSGVMTPTGTGVP
jgi:inorganic pyrophosphatase